MMSPFVRALLLLALPLLASADGLAQVRYDHLPKKFSSYSLTDNRWSKTTISYRFKNVTRDFPNSEATIRRAFDMWTTASGLRFIEVPNDRAADITISWASGRHGDQYPFTSRDTLAHASIPEDDTEIHFNEDEDWTDAERNGRDQPIDLLTVAAHEIGHALGLDHSNDRNSLMYPTYTGSHRYLDADDVAGIQGMYPKRDQILDGRVTFDIARNRPFRVGSGEYAFDFEFSQCSTNCVYVYNDSDNTDGVALVNDAREIGQVSDPTRYDMSSRVRTAYEGGLFVLKNNHGYYALAKLLDVEYKDSSDEPGVHATVEYKIIPRVLISTWVRKPSLYASPALSGSVTGFNYTDNDGTFTIGSGDRTFDTKWSGRSDTSIYAYNDSETVDSVALAPDAREIEQVTDPTRYDRSSRARTVEENGILILKNNKGYYAVLKVTDVEYAKGVSFRYKIFPDRFTSESWSPDERRYTSTALEGSVRDFDLTKNSGVFRLGAGDHSFTTGWSGCSTDCVYLYNDHDEGLQLSLASGVSEIGQVRNLDDYPKAQRLIKVGLNGVVILRNSRGQHAVLKVVRIAGGGNSTRLSFDYKIIND